MFLDLQRKNPRKQAHLRWLTTAYSNLQLFISIKTPDGNLITLTESRYIKVYYTPMWFHMKMK